MKRWIAILTVVALLSLLAACAGQTDEPEPSATTTTTEYQAPTFDVEEDDQKIEISTGSTTMVYYHDGTKVTGFEMHIQYDSEEEAETMYTALMEADTVGQTSSLDAIERNGSRLIYVYNEENYGSISLDEVRKMAENQ